MYRVIYNYLQSRDVLWSYHDISPNTQNYFQIRCPICGNHPFKIFEGSGRCYCRCCNYRGNFKEIAELIERQRIRRRKQVYGKYSTISFPRIHPKTAYGDLLDAERYMAQSRMSNEMFKKIYMNDFSTVQENVFPKAEWEKLKGMVRPFFKEEFIPSKRQTELFEGSVFSCGGIIKRNPDTYILGMDFSGIEARVAAEMERERKRYEYSRLMASFGAAGSKAGNEMRKAILAMTGFTDATMRLEILKTREYLKGEWVFMDDLKGKNDKLYISCASAFNPNEIADMVTRKNPFMYTKGVKPEQKKRIPKKDRIPHLSKKENEKRIRRSNADLMKFKKSIAPPVEPFEPEKIEYHNLCTYVFVHQSLIHKGEHLAMVQHIHGKKTVYIDSQTYYFEESSSGDFYCQINAVKGHVARLKTFFKTIHSAKWLDSTKINVQCVFEDF